MAYISCPECQSSISEKAYSCPHCGYPLREVPVVVRRKRWGWQWKSETSLLGWPLVHIAIGFDQQTGKLLVAKGIIAIGWFAIGLITVAQFGVGLLFGFGQFIAGLVVIAQFAMGGLFGLGQFACGMVAIGQMALGEYVLCQIGVGKHVWSTKVVDPEAQRYFMALWEQLLHWLYIR